MLLIKRPVLVLCGNMGEDLFKVQFSNLICSRISVEVVFARICPFSSKEGRFTLLTALAHHDPLPRQQGLDNDANPWGRECYIL
jgi:hypothetical protein